MVLKNQLEGLPRHFLIVNEENKFHGELYLLEISYNLIRGDWGCGRLS